MKGGAGNGREEKVSTDRVGSRSCVLVPHVEGLSVNEVGVVGYDMSVSVRRHCTLGEGLGPSRGQGNGVPLVSC